MVSIRCRMIVQQELDKLSIRPLNVELGEVDLGFKLPDDKKALFAQALIPWGLELIDDRKTIMIERIKSAIIEMVYNLEQLPETNYSTYLSNKLNYDYTYLSNTFSYVTSITIEHYIILHKIERAKNMLVANELSISQIAAKLNYSSSAHLSNQFKKVTGLTPSYFKIIRSRTRQGKD